MRYILQDEVYEKLPDDWDEIVQKAKDYVQRKVDEAKTKAESENKSAIEVAEICLKARNKAINAKSSVWRAAEEALSAASYEKCWYCESKQDRSDMPIDHFRPKNSVVEADNHPGYHWLAFEWRNYRYCCTFCNSVRCDKRRRSKGGKQDHFPIFSPPPYARCATDWDIAKLLDPVNDDDAQLLTFLPNGRAHPSQDDPVTIDRVETSIMLYHLDHTKLVRRRKMLAFKIARHVRLADNATRNGDNENSKHHRAEIIKLVREKAELRTAARTYLCAYRARPWVEAILIKLS